MNRIRRSVIGVLGAGIAAAVVPIAFALPANAAGPAITVTSANGVLTIQGTANADDIVVRGTAASLSISAYPFDTSVITVPSTCTQAPGDLNDATCAGPFTRVVVNGGKGDDHSNTRSAEGVPATLDGGEGDDILIAGSTADVLDGDQGDDTLRGGAGDDFLTGGLGIGFDTDADVFDGGSGTDTADYFGHNPGAVVTRDGVANDGSPNEKDNVQADVEKFVGRVTVLS